MLLASCTYWELYHAYLPYLAVLLRAAQSTVLYGAVLQMAIQAICLLCYTAPLPRGERHCAFFCLYIAATVPQVGLWDNTE